MSEHGTTKDLSIEIGQVWQENDPRITRFVKVVGFEGPYGVLIHRCRETGELSSSHRQTTALRRRFNGHRSGYKRIS